MKVIKNTLEQGFESALEIIGDIFPISIGMRNPAILLKKAEQFFSKKSQEFEAFVNRKINAQYRKESIREQISTSSLLPQHRIRTEESFQKGLSKEDVLKRLAEIDRMIITREQEQKKEH